MGKKICLLYLRTTYIQSKEQYHVRVLKMIGELAVKHQWDSLNIHQIHCKSKREIHQTQVRKVVIV
jgi:hypothetical protein